MSAPQEKGFVCFIHCCILAPRRVSDIYEVLDKVNELMPMIIYAKHQL